MRNLEKQEELAREEYRLKEKVEDLVERMERLCDEKEEIAKKHANHKIEFDRLSMSSAPNAFSVRRDRDNQARLMQDCAKNLETIEADIQIFKGDIEIGVGELEKLENKILTLNQSLIRLRQKFSAHISKVAAVQAVNMVKEIEKRDSNVGCVVQ